ncbi:MAG TPA: hypothetical protein VLT36_05425, partial [Candidatus Dormibacteraeota bacterium]|nr:hypothetical protein [Candidatus Dormibacteraeota bacterium]
TVSEPAHSQAPPDSTQSKIEIQNSKIASDCSSRPDEAVFLDPTQHASNGTKPPPINTPVHPRANDAPPPSTVSTVSESAALINTPIDRGANDAPPSPTVSTVSEPAHSQAPPDSTQSKIEIQNSKIPQIPELCPGCQHELPEPTPDGQRPRPECWFCGRRLLPPNTELCPGCRQALPSLALSGERPYENCTLCGFRLSPPGEASIIFTSYSSGPQPAEQ